MDVDRGIYLAEEYAYNDNGVSTNVISEDFEEQSVFEIDQSSDIIQCNKLNMNTHSFCFYEEKCSFFI